ncbi:MAG: hypothetical protein KGI37_10230 [Alphaproteobacteria bacterium]|nr:hypothetical protein [Alphaproteobacteria bacterium]
MDKNNKGADEVIAVGDLVFENGLVLDSGCRRPPFQKEYKILVAARIRLGLDKAGLGLGHGA